MIDLLEPDFAELGKVTLPDCLDTSCPKIIYRKYIHVHLHFFIDLQVNKIAAISFVILVLLSHLSEHFSKDSLNYSLI